MNRLDITFMSIDRLYKMIISDSKAINYKVLGVKLDQEVKLCALLYSKRKLGPSSEYKLYVDHDSFETKRIPIIEFLIDEIISQKQLGKSLKTIGDNIRLYMKFINWIDDNNNIFPTNLQEARKHYISYTYYLISLIRRKSHKQQTVSKHQKKAKFLLENLFDDKKSFISLGVQDILYKSSQIESTQKSPDKDIQYSFSFYTSIFVQISDFILKKKNYPFRINLANEPLWIWCGNPWVMPSHKRQQSTRFKMFNYETGSIRTEEEIIKLFGKNIHYKESRNRMENKLKRHNSTDTSARKALAQVAQKAYFMHFIALTGMNDSTAATLQWDEKYTVENEMQNFKTIKCRAKNKLVEFSIQKEFIDQFNTFIKLRKYLLKNKDYKYLFFTGFDDHAHLSNRQRDGAWSSIINTYFKKIDPNLPSITSRKSRVNKTHYMVKRHGLLAASAMSQSSISTIRTNYLGESEESAGNQISHFLNLLDKNVIFAKDKGEDIAIGQCKEKSYPVSLNSNVNMQPDCRQIEGCLFCDKFGIHTDEKDIRKLISFQYLIIESKFIATSKEHFNSVFSSYLKRIEYILTILSKQDKAIAFLIKNIKKDVFENENLDPFWERKMETLLKMGVIK